MKKIELIELLKLLGVPFNEGIQSDKNTNSLQRIVFWDYIWEPISASGDEYNTLVTYQVSFFSKTSRNSKLIKLKEMLKDKGLKPIIYHEYDQKNQEFHSYFSLEVLENIE